MVNLLGGFTGWWKLMKSDFDLLNLFWSWKQYSKNIENIEKNQNFAGYRTGSAIPIILVFILHFFPRETNDKIFKKIQKSHNFGPFWAKSFPKFGQNWIFLEKRALSVFKYSNYLPPCKKLEKTNEPFLRKILNWQCDRQQWFCRTISRLGVQFGILWLKPILPKKW